MHRLAVPITAVALVISACGGDDAAPGSVVPTSEAAADTTGTTQTTEAPVAPEAPTTTTGGTSATTDAPTAPTEPAATTPPPEGPPAPDFTLALGEGGSFTLSEAQKPVYMVFWAEW
jgi:hypothetical protein